MKNFTKVLMFLLLGFMVFTLYSMEKFSFSVTADMRKYSGEGKYDTPEYFRGVVEAIKKVSKSAFMVSPGDIDPPSQVYWTISKYLGKDFLWFPVVGNHEAETSSDMNWILNYKLDKNGDLPPNIVNWGPQSCKKTTYSFDYKNSHFIILNEYCEGYNVWQKMKSSGGNITDELYSWLLNDINKTKKEHIFVFGHSPAYPMPDYDTVRMRHERSSLNYYRKNRTRFWKLLKEKNVVAYFCGHTHNYSITNISGVWQIDAGHARGIGDKGSPSTFIIIDVKGKYVYSRTYRINNKLKYKIRYVKRLR